MASTGPVSDYLSPESTVTTLLASSGHLRSSLLPTERSTTFRYRDKDYDSASAALDAYIADFDRSRMTCEASTERLVLPKGPSSTPSRPKVAALRNKDVLRECLTDRELDVLSLPISSLHHRGNRDRLSMTTDELLSIPLDGSMPVTHTSAFLQGLLSHSRASQALPSFRPRHRAEDGASSPAMFHPHSSRKSRRSRCQRGTGAVMSNPDVAFESNFMPPHKAVRSEWVEPSSSLPLPRQFTGNKADMDCSGISSVPDLKYPAWIQRCDLSEPPALSESDLWDNLVPKTRAPSWLADLEKEDEAPSQADSQQTLRDLRLQFAEQISRLAAERESSIVDSLFRDNRLESLIEKADQVLNSLSQGSGGAGSLAGAVSGGAVSPVKTEDSAAEGVAERRAELQCSGPRDNSIWKQPGPVEALKQMMFRLQAVEAELQRRQQSPSNASAITDKQHTDQSAKQKPEAEAALASFAGGASLQRALHHLSRLKLLVGDPQENLREEEKDPDEGRYSSSSAEGLASIHQTPR
ncbi:lung adenoma susceptibility protein 2 isoform 2-T2 [Aulostomus maculatus]